MLSQIEILNNILIQNSKPIDVICLQETWLGSGADASLLQLDGYRLLLHGDANSNHRGVDIYIKSSLPYTIKPESIINSLWEALFIEISYPEINGCEKWSPGPHEDQNLSVKTKFPVPGNPRGTVYSDYHVLELEHNTLVLYAVKKARPTQSPPNKSFLNPRLCSISLLTQRDPVKVYAQS
jgi:hypothetical protein